jgi:hypothetical protein
MPEEGRLSICFNGPLLPFADLEILESKDLIIANVRRWKRGGEGGWQTLLVTIDLGKGEMCSLTVQHILWCQGDGVCLVAEGYIFFDSRSLGSERWGVSEYNMHFSHPIISSLLVSLFLLHLFAC